MNINLVSDNFLDTLLDNEIKIEDGVETTVPGKEKTILGMCFNQSLKNFRLSNISQKINLLTKLKVDFIITKKFDKVFYKIKSINFIRQILFQKLTTKKRSENFRPFMYSLKLNSYFRICNFFTKFFL